MNKWLRLFIIVNLLLGTFYFQSVLAYGVETHAALTREVIKFYNQHYPNNPIPAELGNYLIEGSRQEDNPPRWMNHFYDPVYDRGLTSIVFGNWEKSKEWAQSPKKQNQLVYKVRAVIASILTAIQERKISVITTETDFTWQRALEFYRQGEKEKAMYALGHVIHLIEDAAVPDHTRNDPHPAFGDNDSLASGSPYENWTQQFTRQNLNLSTKLSAKNPVPLENLNSYFTELANYSNNNFYSKDTIGLGEYKAPEPNYDEKIGKHFYSVRVDKEFGDYYLLQKSTPGLLVIQKFNITIDAPLVLRDYWDRLSVKAVQHGAGVIDLFFKEAEKAKNQPVQQKPKSVFARVLNAMKPKPKFTPVAEIILNKPTTTITVENNPLTSLVQVSPKPPVVNLPKAPTLNQPKIETPAKTTAKAAKNISKTVAVSKPTVAAPAAAPKFCSFNTTQSPLRQNLLINEVAWMGTNNSANDEWIELRNTSGGDLNIGGWQLLDQGEQIKIIFEPAAKISSGGYYLLERTDDNTVLNIKADLIYTGALSNTNEGLRLFDSQCKLVDEIFASPEWPAGNAAEKKTLERDYEGFGWHTAAVVGGTPRQENSRLTIPASTGGGGSASLPQASSTGLTPASSTGSSSASSTSENNSGTVVIAVNHPVISEVLFDAEGADEGKEFIELYNPTDQPVDMSSWSIQHLSGRGNLTNRNFKTGNVIQPKSFFLIWLGDDPRADFKWLSGSLNNTGATIFLSSNTEPVATGTPVNVVDRLAYGSGTLIMPEMIAMSLTGINPGQGLERKAFETSACVSARDGGEFSGNGCDRDNNSTDFEIRPAPNPQNSRSLPEPRTAPTAVQNLKTEFNSSTLEISFGWDPSQDFSGATSTLRYQVASIQGASSTMAGGTTSTTYLLAINEIGTDYNFEVKAVDQDGLSSAPATSTIGAPSFLSNVYFFRDPRNVSGTDYLVDLRWTDYPFVKKSLFDGGSDGSWKLAVFYLNKDPEQLPYFYSETQYNNLSEDDPVKLAGEWGLKAPGALRIRYGNCASSETIGGALILPDTPKRCSAGGGIRNLTLGWSGSAEDNHLVLSVAPGSFIPSASSTDFITVAFYSYGDNNNQVLVAVDKKKYFYQESVPAFQRPRIDGEITFNYDEKKSRLSISWPKAGDPDSPDGALTYEIQYGSSTVWYPKGTENSAVKFIADSESFNVKVRARDEFGNYSEEKNAVFKNNGLNEGPFTLSSLTCAGNESDPRFGNKVAFKYFTKADDEVFNQIKLSQRYYNNSPSAKVKIYSFSDENNPEAGSLLAESDERGDFGLYPSWLEAFYELPTDVLLGVQNTPVWFVTENSAGASSLETQACSGGSEVLEFYEVWFKRREGENRGFWHELFFDPALNETVE